MGVLNVTPDSFSDGGRWLDADGPSPTAGSWRRTAPTSSTSAGSRPAPGAQRVPVEEELRRVLPVVRELAADGVAVSIDTMRAAVAAAALSRARRWSTTSAGGSRTRRCCVGRGDQGSVRRHALAWAQLRMNELAAYDDVVADVCSELSQRLDAAVDAGVDVEAIILDPGLGFAKDADHNWALLAHLDALHQLGRPLLVGASRKRFLGALLADAAGEQRPMDERDDATAAVTALASAAGAWGVRVHEVEAVSTLSALLRLTEPRVRGCAPDDRIVIERCRQRRRPQ